MKKAIITGLAVIGGLTIVFTCIGIMGAKRILYAE